MRVLAALSGGVDSAVATALALEAGHEVTGVHLRLASGCGDDAADAQQVADVLGIPCEVWDLSDEFASTVVADFLGEYAAGRTPNPCVRCNDRVKFGVLVTRAQALGFDAVCTGHYAQVTTNGQMVLRRSAYLPKDQSYVLAAAGPARLAHAMFPLGETASKDEVRALAAARGLPVAAKRDSLDLCFVPDGDLRGYLRRNLGPAPGEIVETDGTVVGHHDGTHGFTIGQRRGLSIGRPAADGRPRYVVALDPILRQVVVGPAEALDVTTITATTPVWFTDEPVTRCLVQVRAHADPVPAVITTTATTIEIHLDEPLRGVAPGQSAVCYDADRVVVQATITSTDRTRPGAVDSPTGVAMV
ncbi:MAG: tRNA 2-thiouridine(34) synthase MnmA [Micrococcales bacterium]|nr:tRNA 2-thiouridine(34) synthase MnmA [Micrococcales bacterium]